MLSELMKNFQKLLVPIGFSSTICENSLGSSGSAPEPLTNAYDHIFLNYWHNFREKFEKLL